MDTLKLGNIIETEQHRDAVHIAVAPVTANERLAPGQDIGLVGDGAGVSKSPIGIVDPFLKGPVFKGERFWLFLYPGSITSLRHEWTHPAFESEVLPEPIRSKAEAWLRTFAEQDADLTYSALLAGAKSYLEDGEYLCQGGKWEGFCVPDEFWTHYQIVTGTIVPEENQGNFFSCSC